MSCDRLSLETSIIASGSSGALTIRSDSEETLFSFPNLFSFHPISALIVPFLFSVFT